MDQVSRIQAICFEQSGRKPDFGNSSSKESRRKRSRERSVSTARYASLEKANAKSIERMKARSKSRQIRLAQKLKSEQAMSAIERFPTSVLKDSNAYRSFIATSTNNESFSKVRDHSDKSVMSDNLTSYRTDKPSVRDFIDKMR